MATIDLPKQNAIVLGQRQVVILVPATQEIEYARILLEILTSEYRKITGISIALLVGNTIESRSKSWKLLRRSQKKKEYFKLVEDYECVYQKKITLKIYKQNSRSLEIRKIKELDELRINYPGNPALLNSVRSVLASGYSFTADSEYDIRKFWRVTKRLIQDYLVGEILTKRIVSEHGNDNAVYIFLNGRHPSQASIRAEIEKQNSKFLTLDWGEPANERMFLAPFQIQEIEKLQAYFIENQLSLTQTKKIEAMAIADDWFKKQSSELHFNRYHTSLAIPAKLRSYIKDRRTAIIFTSSADEELYNLKHNTNGWASQMEAIVAASHKLLEKDFQVIVRIHPNASNKSWKDLANTVNQLKKNRINYILPWDKVSSYRLIEEAQLVGAWVSRIAVEAAYMQKDSFYLGIGPFSHISGIALISPSNLNQILEHASLKVNRESLQLAVYQNLNFGEEVSRYKSSEFSKKSKTSFDAIYSSKLIRIKYLAFRIIEKAAGVSRKSTGPFGTPANFSHRLRFLKRVIDPNVVLNTYLESYLKRHVTKNLIH